MVKDTGRYVVSISIQEMFLTIKPSSNQTEQEPIDSELAPPSIAQPNRRHKSKVKFNLNA